MLLAELNGYVAIIPESGGKAGKGKAVTGHVQVRKNGVLIKQFRFSWGSIESGLTAARKAKALMESNQ